MLSIIYATVMQVRNRLFDWGVLRQQSYDVPIVGVGNLAVGGTGKTPHVEWLLRAFPELRTAVLSRGYGRNTHGFRLVDATASASEVGDEPLQIKKKFPASTVCVCEKRVVGMNRLLDLGAAPQLVVLDDNLQHRYVRAGLQLLLTQYMRPYSKDCVMPHGRLRERASGAARADIIVVTKCPESLSDFEKKQILESLVPLPHQKVLFSTMVYGQMHPFQDNSPFEQPQLKGKRVLLVTGVANTDSIFLRISGLGAVVDHMRYGDHHRFTTKEVERINARAETADYVITTEKDAMRMLELRHAFSDQMLRKTFVQPIEVKFIGDGEQILRDEIGRLIHKQKNM